MAFANTAYSDILATTIENRSGVVADNVSKNTAVLAKLKAKGRVRTFSGGTLILQELAFQENGTFMYYAGGEPLNINPSDVISAAQFPIKQAAVAVTMTGLEDLQNSSSEQIIDLFDARLDVAESTMVNNLSTGVYSDGTGTGGKQITGLQAMIVASPATGVVGGIDRANWSFWRNQVFDFSTDLGVSASASNINVGFNALWAKCVRNATRPDLIALDNKFWSFYMAANQNLQRFVGNSDLANLGFTTVKYMDADVVLDGGIGGGAPTATGYFLNTEFLFWRPHSRRNMVPIGDDRTSTNQDAFTRLLGFAGNLCASGLQFQGLMQE